VTVALLLVLKWALDVAFIVCVFEWWSARK
jgi:hypothetical protein